MTSRSESRHLTRVAELGCILCDVLGHPGTPAQVHHVRAMQGMAQRAQHWLTVPLCQAHHTGPTGVHGDRSALKNAKVDELDLLALTLEKLL